MTKNTLYYHAYLTDDYGSWATIFMEQMKLLEDSGLKDNLENAHFTCITSNRDIRWKIFNDLRLKYFPKSEFFPYLSPNENDAHMLQQLNTDSSMTENIILHKMWKNAQSTDENVLYLHTKGVTAQKKHLEIGDVDTYVKYYYWRNYMQWGVVEKWQDCVEALKTYDTAGTEYLREPSPHYMGNFWWSKSEHIRKLPDPADKEWFEEIKRNTNHSWLKTAANRFRDEMWICSDPNTKSYNVFNVEISPLEQPIKRKSYEINL